MRGSFFLLVSILSSGGGGGLLFLGQLHSARGANVAADIAGTFRNEKQIVPFSSMTVEKSSCP